MRNKIIITSVGLFVFLALVLMTGSAFARTEASGLTACGSSGVFVGENGLTVKKDVFCEKTRSWNWSILKSVAADNPLILSLGQVFPVSYTVTASAVAEDSNFYVQGHVAFINRGAAPITISSVSDSLAPVTCSGVTFPFELIPGDSVNCLYEANLGSAAPENTATVTTVDGIAVTAVAPINWDLAVVTGETGQCVNVDDSLAGPLGQVCVGEQTTFTFSYPYNIGPYKICGDFTVDNTAVIRETGASASVQVNVKVPCAGGCSLTPGYWKTHSIFGPAPYDETWAGLGENTLFFFSGKSYYEALWTAPQGNAYYILAHAYIAARLNQMNGADFSAAQAAFDAATALFSNSANTPAYVATLKGSAKNTWTNLATILDNYNNGLIGPGHCSE